MKKIIVTLVVLLLTAPAWADVTITATDVGGGVVEITYDSNEASLIRAFALDITVNDGNIVDVNDDVNADYDIYPGSIQIDGAGNITDAGSAVCSDAYPGTLGGLGTNGATIEAASLYEAGVDPAPAASGLLLKLTVSEDCTLTIAENAIRGGIVLEDVTSPTVLTLNGCDVSFGPPCWAYAGQPYGDSDGNGSVGFADLVALKASWMKTDPDLAYDPCADFDRNGSVSFADLVTLKQYWMQPVPPVP